MNEKIEVLLTIPLVEDAGIRIGALSPLLNVNIIKANRVEDIPPDLLATAEVLYTSRALPASDQAPNLRWIQFHFAGIDHAVNSPILQRENLIATNLSGASATQMAEYVLMMLLALGHRMPDLFDHQHRSSWPKDRWERFASVELRQSTVGIVGYGSIGRQVARLLHPFGVKVLATKRDLKHPEDRGYIPEGFGDPGGDYVDRLYPAEALASMAKICDFLVVTVPLTPDTRSLINTEIFDVMKDSAYIVDASRGGVINHAALLNALEKKKIAGAALDVFPEEPLPPDSPLWKLPNVILTPHISGESRQYDERALQLFLENLRRYLADEPLLNRIEISRGY
jgi:phosphoglycerate dehydrogenase-like enzyme